MIFMQGLNFLGPKFLGVQISRGPNFLGPKKIRNPNEIGEHFSYSLQVGTYYLLANSGQYYIAWRHFLVHENECELRYYFSPLWKHRYFLIDRCQLTFQLLCVIIIHSCYIVRSIIHQWSNGTRLHMPHFSYHLLLWHWWLMEDMPLLLLQFRVCM